MATAEAWIFTMAGLLALGAAIAHAGSRRRRGATSAALAVIGLVVGSIPVYPAAVLLQLAGVFGLRAVRPISETIALGGTFGVLALLLLGAIVPMSVWAARLGRERAWRSAIASTVSALGPPALAAVLIVEPMAGWPGIGRPFIATVAFGTVRDVLIAALAIAVLVAAMKLVGILARDDGGTVGDDGSAPPDLLIAGAALSGALVAGAVAASVLALDPNFIDTAHWIGFPLPPGAFGHLLGTDESGRDLLARLLLGAGRSLAIAVAAAVLATAIATAVAFAMRQVRTPTMPSRDVGLTSIRVFGAFPFVLAAQSVLSAVSEQRGTSDTSLAVVIGCLVWTPLVAALRTARSRRDVLAATASVAAGALLLEVSVSAWGYGVQPPRPSLGTLLVHMMDNSILAPWAVWIPVCAAVVAVFALNALAEGLRIPR